MLNDISIPLPPLCAEVGGGRDGKDKKKLFDRTSRHCRQVYMSVAGKEVFVFPFEIFICGFSNVRKVNFK